MKNKKNDKVKNLIKNGTKKYIIISTIMLSICTLLNIYASVVIKNGLNQLESNNIKKIFIIFFTLLLVAYLLKMLIIKYQFKFAYKYKVKQSKDLYKEIFKMKYLDFINKEPTYLAERIKIAVETLYTYYSNAMSTIYVDILGIVIIFILMSFTNKFIALLLIIILIFKYVGYKKINHSLSKKSMILQEVCANNFKEILSIISNTDYIKQLGNTESTIKLLSKNIENIERETCDVSKFGKVVSTTLEFLLDIIQNIVYIYSLYLVTINKMPLSDLVFISLLSALYFKFIGELVNTNINIRDFNGVINFIDNEVLSFKEDDGFKDISSIDTINLNINDFGFDKILVEKGDCTINKGDIVGIRGDSGTGKSSLIKGLLKFYKVNTIYINGININEIKNESLRSKIDYISQNIPIIPASIEENIIFGRDVCEEQLEKIKKMSFLNKFSNLQNGFDTKILENGMNLSGGDKQKIAIARLLLDKPDILILDETTNSIDKKTSLEILDYILNEFKDNIVLFISHEDYIFDYCNKIIKLENNTITEC